MHKTVILNIDGIEYEIQFNFCTNPFCKLFGEEQYRFEHKYKPSIYKTEQKGKDSEPYLVCNDDPTRKHGVSLGCNTKLISNWAAAEEIRRLARQI